MSNTKLRGLIWSCLVVLILLPCTSEAQTSKQTETVSVDEKQLLRDLLYEVRQLRLALQRANLTAYRTQIALERIKIQQSKVDGLMRELNENQNELTGVKLSRLQLQGQMKDLESDIKLETDANQRTQQETESKELKRALEQQAEREVLLNERRSSLNAQLQSEQAKLDELNNNLAGIEYDLQEGSKDDGRKQKKQTP